MLFVFSVVGVEAIGELVGLEEDLGAGVGEPYWKERKEKKGGRKKKKGKKGEEKRRRKEKEEEQ